MSNMPDINKIQRSMKTPRELDARILRKFKADGSMSVKEAYICALEYAAKDVVLGPEDYRRIAEATKTALAKRNRSRK